MAIEMQVREQIVRQIAAQPMRVLVEEYPRLMPLLAGYSMDLCCGGGHTAPEAARLHGLDVDTFVNEVAAVITEVRG